MKKHLIILSGGIGSRIGSDIPKQYIKVGGKSILEHTLKRIDLFQFSVCVIVVADQWKEFIATEIQQISDYSSFLLAPAGKSRQESILNGLIELKKIAHDEDIVVIHDAARACIKNELVTELIFACKNYDGVLPVLPVKDTIYVSSDGNQITGLLNRDELFIGQSPEAFKYKKYFEINNSLSSIELSKVKGSSEIAFLNGLNIKLIKGDESNFKITTIEDLNHFKTIMENKE